MTPRQIILLVAAVAIAGITAFAVKHRMTPPPAMIAQKPAVTQVLVAKQDIPAGSFVKAGQDIDWADWPADAVQPSYIRKENGNINAYNGAVARMPLHAGEAIAASALMKPGAGGFLSAVLDPGKRAVSIPVLPNSGSAGLIFPGDHVDLIVTHHLKFRPAPNAQEQDAVVSDTFVENARVVAVDQQLDNPDNKAIMAKSITVEVTPEEAQRIAVAEDMGKISFALRSLAVAPPKKPEKDAYEDPFADMHKAASAPRFTRDTDISRVLDQKSAVSPRVTVIRGDQVEQHEFYQGGQ